MFKPGNGRPIGPTNFGGVDGIVLESKFKLAMTSMAKAVAEDVNRLTAATQVHNEVLKQFEGAHNHVSDLTETLLIQMRFLLEKTGYIDPEGKPSPEFSGWMADKKREYDDLAAAHKLDALPEPALPGPVAYADGSATPMPMPPADSQEN
jgi:hypothetical protein